MEGQDAGLGTRELEALVRRYLSGEPSVFSRSVDEGTVFFTRGDSPSVDNSARFFCITRGGGLLLRLQEADQERFAQKGNIGRNAGLPAWLGPIADELTETGPDDPVQVKGDPREWVWMRVEDEQAFNKRKPIVHEAMAYARHLIAIAAEG